MRHLAMLLCSLLPVYLAQAAPQRSGSPKGGAAPVSAKITVSAVIAQAKLQTDMRLWLLPGSSSVLPSTADTMVLARIKVPQAAQRTTLHLDTIKLNGTSVAPAAPTAEAFAAWLLDIPPAAVGEMDVFFDLDALPLSAGVQLQMEVGAGHLLLASGTAPWAVQPL